MQYYDPDSKTQCLTCKHLICTPVAFCCPAFAWRGIPGEVPEDILTGEFRHTKLHPLQTNPKILYTPKEKEAVK